MGEVRMLFRKPSSNKPMVSESSLEVVEDKGIKGDKSFGSRKRQVLLVEEEILNKYGRSLNSSESALHCTESTLWYFSCAFIHINN